MNTLKRNIKTLISTIKSSSRHVTKKWISLFNLKKKTSISSKIAKSNVTTAVSIKPMVPESAESIHSSLLMSKLKVKLFEMIENHESGPVDFDTKANEEEAEEKNCEITLTVIKLEDNNNNLNLNNQKQQISSSRSCYESKIIRKTRNNMTSFFYTSSPKVLPTYSIPKKIYFNLFWIISQIQSIQQSHNPMDFVDYRHYFLKL